MDLQASHTSEWGEIDDQTLDVSLFVRLDHMTGSDLLDDLNHQFFDSSEKPSGNNEPPTEESNVNQEYSSLESDIDDEIHGLDCVSPAQIFESGQSTRDDCPAEKQEELSEKRLHKRDKKRQNESVKKSRAKIRAKDAAEKSELQRLMFLANKLSRDGHDVKSIPEQEYPESMGYRLHGRRPMKRAKAANEMIRKDRVKEVNKAATKRHELRRKFDRKQRQEKIKFLKLQIETLTSGMRSLEGH